MDEKDRLIEMLQEELDAKDKEIARLAEITEVEASLWKSEHTKDRLATRDSIFQTMIEHMDSIIKNNEWLYVNTWLDKEKFTYVLDMFLEVIIRDDSHLAFLDWTDDIVENNDQLYVRHALLLYLMYACQGLPHEFLAAHFHINQSTASMYIKSIEEKLAGILPTADELSRWIREAESKEQVKELIRGDNGGTILVDGFSSNMKHLDDKRRGKRKQFLINTILYANTDMIILSIEARAYEDMHNAVEPRIHAPRFGRWKKSMLNSDTLPADRISIDADDEFMRVRDDYPGANILTPHKKSRCAKLTRRELRDDIDGSKEIITTRNPVCKVRRYGRMCDPYEIMLEDYGRDGYGAVVKAYREDLNIITGLENLRTAWDDIQTGRGPIARIMKEKRAELGL